MSDWLVDLALAVLFSVLKQVVKNPEKKKSLARAMIKLRRQLEIAYPPDQDGVYLGG